MGVGGDGGNVTRKVNVERMDGNGRLRNVTYFKCTFHTVISDALIGGQCLESVLSSVAQDEVRIISSDTDVVPTIVPVNLGRYKNEEKQKVK